jgi:2,5-diketo-D-gluconate reductase B
MNKFLALILMGMGGLVPLCAEGVVEVDLKGKCWIEKKQFPVVGFGTYPYKGDECKTAVENAAHLGYRIIDTATYYRNFEPIAQVLKKEGRDKFYLISKVWHDKQTPDALRLDLLTSLAQLQTDHLDLYFLHWPNSEVSIEETLSVLDEFRRAKLIRHIGLSNVNANHLKRALEVGVPISWVQVEMNPLFYDAELLEFCKKHSIGVQAWAPLARGKLKDDAMLQRIGKKYGKSASQVAIRWIIQHGAIPLPGSKSDKHIRENSDVLDFVLSDEDMQEIDLRARSGKRERVKKSFAGFIDEYDFTYEQCWPKR